MRLLLSSILSLSYGLIIAQNTTLTSASLNKIEARCIGPAVMGGRITAIDGVENDPRILYVGCAGGGIWKTTNGGSEFKSIFDKHCQSIGALAINQKNPEEVWVGTGESNMRNTVSVGNGVYKTTDGGENWTFMGLPNSEHISKVVIHPQNPNTVYVAVVGKLWGNSSERGLYKTIDGGKNWQRILFVNDSTGCADFIMNPSQPDILYASMWQVRRKPYAFASGGPGSAIMKSTDGGATWKKIQKGLPAGDIGRAALAIAPSAPDKLVMIVESKKTSLFLTTDAGETWVEQGADDNVCARPFYFSCLAIDPIESNRVYRPAFYFSMSEDGGHSWAQAQQSNGWVHSDLHALWINPKNTSHMYLGTDGGVYMSVDKGNNWLFLNNFTVSQLYHVQVDDQEPYNVYGGLQDNGSWRAPSQNPGGIQNGDWKNVGGGDGFWVQPDAENHKIVYSEYQGGHISRLDLNTNHSQDIQPKAEEGDPKLRFNWNTPIVRSLNNKKRIYMASQFLYRSDDKGIHWEKMSGDLTTNDLMKLKQEESGGLTNDNTSAENHCTIFTIAESPLDVNTVWAGTDDGNLQVTTDGGKTWTNVADNYKRCGIPAQTWVSSIEPSRFDKNTVYATFDNHMYSDMNTYVAKSSDLGKTWVLFKSSEFKGFAHKIKEDLVRKDLLFVGTEMGLYTSLDGGKNWLQMKGNIPTYALVRDIVIEPRTNDLVLATHGRGVLIVDDISPLRNISAELLQKEAAFIPSRSALAANDHFGSGWPDAGGFVGPNATEDAVITYYLKDRVNSGGVKIAVYDANGKFLVDLPGTKRKGINKVYWNKRLAPPRLATGGAKADWTSTIGPMVQAGKYKLKLIVGEKSFDGDIELKEDAKANISAEDRAMNAQLMQKTVSLQEDLAKLMDSVTAEQNKLKENLNDDKVIKEYFDSLEVVRAELVPVKTGRAVLFADEEKLRDKVSDIYAGVLFYDGRPTNSQTDGLKKLGKEFEKTKAKFELRKKTYTPLVEPILKRVKKSNPY